MRVHQSSCSTAAAAASSQQQRSTAAQHSAQQHMEPNFECWNLPTGAVSAKPILSVLPHFALRGRREEEETGYRESVLSTPKIKLGGGVLDKVGGLESCEQHGRRTCPGGGS